MNDEVIEFGKKYLWLNGIISRHLPETQKKNKHGNPQSKYTVSRPRFEPSSSRIQVWIITGGQICSVNVT
jgi:hypothetical protein